MKLIAAMTIINIEIIYGTADKQFLQSLTVATGTTVRQAISLSQIQDEFPDAELANTPVGIFGKIVPDNTILRAQDRIEIYRPLLIDPKEARRLRVQSQSELNPEAT